MKYLVLLLTFWLANNSTTYASSVIFSRDTITIRTIREETIIVEPEKAEQDDNNTAEESTDVQTTEPDTQIRKTIKNHQFVVTIRNAHNRNTKWVIGENEVRGQYGILHIYDQPSPAEIHATQSEAAYDILFIDSYGTIHSIAKNIVPSALLEPLMANKPSKAVLYVTSNTVDNLSLAPNDTVIHPLFPEKPKLVSD